MPGDGRSAGKLENRIFVNSISDLLHSEMEWRLARTLVPLRALDPKRILVPAELYVRQNRFRIRFVQSLQPCSAGSHIRSLRDWADD
jgi:hypothetical protein